MSLVEVRGLRYRYPDGTEALRGIDFDLMPGETVALFGANGSGKTTFVLHLNGLLYGEGTVRVCGIDVTPGTVREIRPKVGLVFQDSDEQLFMPTVLEDVCFGPLNQGHATAEARRMALAALSMVGMAHSGHKAPYHLSSGEKKRVAIAGVLAMSPQILILDEPSTYLDPPGQRTLADLLAGLPQARIIVTHDIHLARRLATRAVFFSKGKVEGTGSVEEILQRFRWSV